MLTPNNFRLGKVNSKFINSKSYKYLKNIIVVTCLIFLLLYLFRGNLYKMEKQFITLFAGIAPNLIASFLFSIIGMFFLLPFFIKIDPISHPRFIWLINILNIIIFSLIEYIHVLLNLALWDNNDIVASLIGILFATAIYFALRKGFIAANNQKMRK